MLNRWHTGNGKGFSLLEAEDQTALSGYLIKWADLVEQTIVPVIEDAEIAIVL